MTEEEEPSIRRAEDTGLQVSTLHISPMLPVGFKLHFWTKMAIIDVIRRFVDLLRTAFLFLFDSRGFSKEYDQSMSLNKSAGFMIGCVGTFFTAALLLLSFEKERGGTPNFIANFPNIWVVLFSVELVFIVLPLFVGLLLYVIIVNKFFITDRPEKIIPSLHIIFFTVGLFYLLRLVHFFVGITSLPFLVNPIFQLFAWLGVKNYLLIAVLSVFSVGVIFLLLSLARGGMVLHSVVPKATSARIISASIAAIVGSIATFALNIALAGQALPELIGGDQFRDTFERRLADMISAPFAISINSKRVDFAGNVFTRYATAYGAHETTLSEFFPVKDIFSVVKVASDQSVVTNYPMNINGVCFETTGPISVRGTYGRLFLWPDGGFYYVKSAENYNNLEERFSIESWPVNKCDRNYSFTHTLIIKFDNNSSYYDPSERDCETAQTAFIGTPTRDLISCKSAKAISAGSGDDIIAGSYYPDKIDAGPGNDIILTQAGDDIITMGTGQDVLALSRAAFGANQVIQVTDFSLEERDKIDVSSILMVERHLNDKEIKNYIKFQIHDDEIYIFVDADRPSLEHSFKLSVKVALKPTGRDDLSDDKLLKEIEESLYNRILY